MKVKIKEISANAAGLEVELNGEKRSYQAEIINNHGSFGVELPPELSLLMQRFPAETKNLVGELRRRSAARLQAA